MKKSNDKISKIENKKIENKKIEKKQVKQQKKEKRKKSRGWKIFRLILIIAIIASLIYAGIFAYKMAKNGGGLQGFMATAMGHNEYTLKDLDKINFLLIGISGYDDYKLADTIMVCSYDPKNQQASLLSIPRDTYVGKNKAKATASYKINSVYRNGENIDGMVKSIEEILEMEIENYIVVDTQALRQVVDAIGGVEFDVPIDMKYDDTSQDLHIDLKAGYQKLNGEQAEWLVRFRHSNNGATYPTEYGDNDLGRMRTQREFITATLKQTLKPSNILKISQIAQIAFNNIKTNVTFDTIKDYIPYTVNFNADNLKTGTLPGTPELANGVWIYTVNKKEAKQMVEELFLDPVVEDNLQDANNISNTTTTNEVKTTTQKEEKIKIELLNGSGSQAKLNDLTKLLKNKGYNVIKTGNTNATAKTSIINRTSQKEQVVKELKQILKVGTTSSKANSSNVDFTIIIGKDYK